MLLGDVGFRTGVATAHYYVDLKLPDKVSSPIPSTESDGSVWDMTTAAVNRGGTS